MAVFADCIRPYFVDPADAGPAVILPIVDTIYVKQVLIGLADCHKQIVISSEPDAPHSRVGEHEPLRDVAKSEPTEPSVSPLKSDVRIKEDQINVIGLDEHILGFVKAAIKNLLADTPLVGMQIRGLHFPLRVSVIVIAACSTLGRGK